MTKRRRHSAEFKAKIALEGTKNERTVNEIAAAYQVHPTQVSQWKKELVKEASAIFSGRVRKQTQQSYEKETAQLHQKIGQLTVELDWLKKKLGT